MFCKRCGGEISDGSKFCKKCGAQVAADTVPPRDRGYAQSYDESEQDDPVLQYHRQYQQEAERSAASHKRERRTPLLAETMATVRRFFSPMPTEALSFAARSPAPVWVILAAVWCLCMGFMFRMLPENWFIDFLNDLVKATGTLTREIDMDYLMEKIRAYSSGNSAMWFEDIVESLFPSGTIIAAGLFFLFSIGTKLLFTLCKTRISFVHVMNLTGAAFLPATVGVLCAALASYVYVPLSFLLLFAGFIGVTLCLYEETRREVRSQKDMFWPYLILQCACLVIVAIVFKSLISDAIEDRFSFMGMEEDILNRIGSLF